MPKSELIQPQIPFSEVNRFNSPQSWAKLVDLMDTFSDWLPEGGLRSPDLHAAYAQYRQDLSQLGLQPADEILTFMGHEEIMAIENKFPYDTLIDPLNALLAPSLQRVVHFCVWSRNGPLNYLQIDRSIRKAIPRVYALCTYTNAPIWQTVKQISHVQAFVLTDLLNKNE